MISTLSSRALRILTTVVLNSQFDDSNIPTISDYDVCFGLQIVCVPFGMPYNFFFFLIARHVVLGKGNDVNSNVAGKEKHSITPAIRSLFFIELMLLNCELHKCFSGFCPLCVEEDG